MKKLIVHSIGPLGRVLDFLMVPVMYLVSGTLKEAPQRTHFWNNKKLRPADVHHLSRKGMVSYRGLNGERKRFLSCIFPIFHTPIFGGWKNYVVIGTVENGRKWHVGWIAGDVIGVSRIVLTGPVRLLIGPRNVKFFGIAADNNYQVPIKKIGRGKVGNGGSYAKTPLL